MSSDWFAAPLSEVLDGVIDHRGRTPKKLGGDFVPSGVRVISAKNIRDGRLDLSFEPRFVSEEMYARWMPKELRSGDVLLTSEAPMGEVAYLNGHARYCLGQRLFALRAKDDVLDGRFLYYHLRSSAGRAALHARISGTTAQGIRQSELVQVAVPVPPLEEQRRIAGVLGALDNKIEHNRATSIRLAEAASVDFERRRRDWATTGSDGVLGQLGGPIAHRASDSELPYIGLDAMPQGTPVLTEWATDGAPTGQSSRFARGDILFGKLRPYFKKVGVAPIDGRCSTEILVLRPTDEHQWGPLLGYVLSDDFIAHCIAHSTGTKMPRSEWRSVEGFSVAIPSAEDATECTEFMRATFGLVTSLTLESRRLAAIRDALLPRLASGKLRVPESYDADDVLGTLTEQDAAD